MIRIDDLNFRYPGRPELFCGLDFEMTADRKIGLVGPNGSGKTTLFHLIMGLLKPVSGSIRIFGKERVSEDDFREVRERIGFLFQDPNDQLFCATVGEDVAFGPFNTGRTRHEVEHIVKETLCMVGLEGYEKRITYKLSGGEKKMVSLATVLAMKPDVLLLDEPTSGLHPAAAKRIVDVLNTTGLPLIAISHDAYFLKMSPGKLLR